MRWFGENWGAPVCEEGEHVRAPVGEICELCSEPIELVDQGLILCYYGQGTDGRLLVTRDFPVHLDCLLKNVGVA